MTRQLSTTVRNARLDTYESTIGTLPVMKIFTGAQPANCAAANSGTELASGSLPSDWMGAAASGLKQLAGTWTLTAGANGTAGHYRIYATGGTTCHEQGLVKMATVIATNALTAANGNVLNFASTTGVAVGDKVTGTGILPDTYVLALTGTTVTISISSTAGVSNGASITFGGDLTLQNTSIASGQTITITQFDLTEGNA
jgi:hypothetical protein